MLDTIWRLAEKNFNVDDFLNQFDLEKEADVFHQGKKRSRKKIHKKSGFNILVSESLNSVTNIKEINEFIIKHKEAFDYLAKMNIDSTLDIGCAVGTDQFTKSINVPSELLGILNRVNVSLEFSVYPASEE